MLGIKQLDAKKKRKILHNLSCWAMCGLPVLGVMIFAFVPILISAYLSFTELHRFDFTAATWAGFSNFVYVFKDPLFWRAILNTLYACLAIPIEMFLGLLIASVLVKDIKGKGFFRALFFVPYICSAAAVTLIFRWIFDTDLGIVNSWLANMGIPKQGFFLDEFWFMPCMLIMMIWGGTGYYVLLYQAALTNVNKSALEAAELDGANAVQKFIHVTLPAISPTTFYMVVMGCIGGLQSFSAFQIICSAMGAGMKFGPNNAGITIVYYLYDRGFNNIFSHGMGIASAAAWILAVFILLLTVFNFKFSKKWVNYD